jgi:myo-inositol 2-dehydrogenase / D-chiro-inositol 1-dehydrogenase
MMTTPASPSPAPASRRDFLKTSTAVMAGGALTGLVLPGQVHAAGDDTLKIGLVGCGGRGLGAAQDAMQADSNCKLTALGDTFADKIDNGIKQLSKHRDKFAVEKDHCFVGFDAYKQVIDSGVDVVVLATPPHFRPVQLRYAIEKGKHVFCEKPVAVDAPGIRSVLETVKLAEEKKLSLVSGLCWRYHAGVRETMKRVLDGAIGEIVAIQENYNTNGMTNWYRGNDPKWSPMEYQIRNWLYYTWLSGDHNVEQHVHSLDKASWLMHEEPPLQATGLGGRQVRTDPKFGQVFDHHAVCYEYRSGVRLFAYCRQQDGTSQETEDFFFGTQGSCQVLQHKLLDRKGEVTWQFRGKSKNMYQVEHDELFASIRAGKPINNGVYMSHSSMLAILGRMSTYTGQTITWDKAMESKQDFSLPKYELGEAPAGKVAMPGITEFV